MSRHNTRDREATAMTDRAVQIAKQFIEAIPHARDLGMKIEETGPGTCTIAMPYDEKLIGDPRTVWPGVAGRM